MSATPAKRGTSTRSKSWWSVHGMTRRGMWWSAMLVAMGLVVWMRSEIGLVVVVGDSMFPTLKSGDILVVHRGVYEEADPARGDIVVARYRSEWIVKRVVGLPGEEVQVIDGVVHVNGAPVPASHPVYPGRLQVHPGDLRQDRFAVLGDNRAAGDGMLFYAVIPRERLMGRVLGALHIGRRMAEPADKS